MHVYQEGAVVGCGGDVSDVAHGQRDGKGAVSPEVVFIWNEEELILSNFESLCVVEIKGPHNLYYTCTCIWVVASTTCVCITWCGLPSSAHIHVY